MLFIQFSVRLSDDEEKKSFAVSTSLVLRNYAQEKFKVE